MSPELVEELEIISSRHALGMRAPAIVVATYDGADGQPKTLIWTPDPADRALAIRWFPARDGGR